jgi:hypothetical protein
MVYSLNSPHGAIDIFRSVTGLPDWAASRQTAVREATGAGTIYYGISDQDMLACSSRWKRVCRSKAASNRCEGISDKPMNESLTDLIREEARKRDRNWNPQERWRVLQETISWVESQMTVRRNTKEACLANQARLLQAMARSTQKSS